MDYWIGRNSTNPKGLPWDVIHFNFGLVRGLCAVRDDSRRLLFFVAEKKPNLLCFFFPCSTILKRQLLEDRMLFHQRTI
jgi:hypothetical protein